MEEPTKLYSHLFKYDVGKNKCFAIRPMKVKKLNYKVNLK